MPFAVIGSEKDVKTSDGRVVKGRQYAWGVAEVENEDHCDFKKLRSILIRTHMLDLIHTTEEQHYEAYRAQQMETRKFGEARPRKLDNPKFKEEEESLRKRFTEQVKKEEARFRQWEQKLISERDRLNKDLESTHAAYVFVLVVMVTRADYCAASSSSKWSWMVCRAVCREATADVDDLICRPGMGSFCFFYLFFHCFFFHCFFFSFSFFFLHPFPSPFLFPLLFFPFSSFLPVLWTCG